MTEKFRTLRIWLINVISPLIVLLLIGLAVREIDWLRDFLVWAYGGLSETGRIVIVTIAGIGMIYFVVRYVDRENAVTRLKTERATLELRLREKEKELAESEEKMIKLAEEGVKENIWRRPDPCEVQFIPRDKRKSVFVSMINLKGGAGKTTLTANLAATLALMENPLNVLIIDLDFQGTLSSLTVEPSLLDNQIRHHFTTDKMLDDTVLPDLETSLPVVMQGASKSKVIACNEMLEQINFQRQAEFFLNVKKDVRFRFRDNLHRPQISDFFDVVIFDCPPRLTTSTINALTCSDYVLIPAQLDEKSFDAVPRTLKWIGNLRHIAQPKILGVIANEVIYWRKNTLLKAHQRGLAEMKRRIHKFDPDIYLFSSMISLDNDIAEQKTPGLAPAADSKDDKVRNLFLGFAKEFRVRIQK